MSGDLREEGRDKQAEDENISDQIFESSRPDSDDTEDDISESEPIFDSVDDVDTKQETVDRTEQEQARF